MKKIKIILLLSASLGFVSLSSAQDGAAIFDDNCTACHRIGGGRLVGPDLKGVHEKRKQEWLVSFIKNSTELIASGDADAKAIFDEYGGLAMPNHDLSDAEAIALINYIGTHGSADAVVAQEGGEEESTEPEEPAVTTDDATQEDIDKGMKLFTGELAFTNGGVACVSCHNVYNDKIIGGGRLAKDLTDVHGRMGDVGISSMVASPPFPAMAEAYKNRPITEDEIYLLSSFFNYSAKQGVYQHTRSWDWVFTFGGGTIFFGFLTWIFFVYFKRKKKSTKHDILSRQGYYDKTK